MLNINCQIFLANVWKSLAYQSKMKGCHITKYLLDFEKFWGGRGKSDIKDFLQHSKRKTEKERKNERKKERKKKKKEGRERLKEQLKKETAL
jgi:hypothetical protein